MSISMEQNILETGKKINNMDMESKHGQMQQNMKETMNMEKNMELELSNGPMAQLILENFTTIMSMGKECILGPIIENMKENGKRIKCMEKVLLLGVMDASTLASTSTIRKMAMANLCGQTVVAIKVIGFTVNSTVRACMSHPKAWRSTVSGRKASVVAGSEEIIRKWPELRLNV